MKIAIVGSASSREFAPWADKSWDIWGLAQNPHERCTMLFEMHAKEAWAVDHQAGYAEYLANLPCPIVTDRKYEEIANSVAYPMEAVKKDIGSHLYFASSFAYMLALAILRKPDEIGVWGVDLIVDEEYIYQRPNAEFLIGVAEGRGIKVTIPKTSALCRCNFVYGQYIGQSPHPTAVGITEEMVNDRIAALVRMQVKAQTAVHKAHCDLASVEGSLAEARGWLHRVQHFNHGGAIGPTAPGEM